jgi:MFS family permease
MTSSVVGGVLSDSLGRRLMIALGYLWYAVIYGAFGYFSTAGVTIAVFLAYGLYFGLTEGVEKAWVADLVPAERRGIAFGIYNSAIGFGSLAASLIFGVLWTRVSPRAAFVTGAALALAASALLATLFKRKD